MVTGNGRVGTGPGSYNNRDRDNERGTIIDKINIFFIFSFYKSYLKVKKPSDGLIIVLHLAIQLKRSASGNHPMVKVTTIKNTTMTTCKFLLVTFRTLPPKTT